jgi:vacuolar-type H+-ATPase subunit I/STV1
MQLREREKESADLQQYLLGKLDEAPPEIRQRIAEALNSDLVSVRDALQAKVAEIDSELKRIAGASQEKIHTLEQEKRAAEMRLSAVSQQFILLRSLLAHSAAKDVTWLDRVRRTMMPKQPGHVPFHNSAEVALVAYPVVPGDCHDGLGENLEGR